jgi:hypothetical protein
MVSVSKGRTALLQARWELEIEQNQGGLHTPPQAPLQTSAEDELKLANHEEVLETSKVRSDDMQKVIRKLLELRRIEKETLTKAIVN